MASNLVCSSEGMVKKDSPANREMYLAACIRKNYLIKEAYYIGSDGEWELVANPMNEIANVVGIHVSTYNRIAMQKKADDVIKKGPNRVIDFNKIAELGKEKYFEKTGSSKLKDIF